MSYLKKFLIASIVLFIVIVGGFFFWLSPRYVVPIVMYHQVEEIAQPQANWVSPANFEWQMAYIKNHGYNVIGLDELVQAIRTNKPVSRKSVVITFDDGYENNYTEAFKILKKYGFPATIFVPSDQVGRPGYLTWDQIKKLVAGGISIGSHTRTEAYLPDEPFDRQKDEIQESKRILEDRLGIPIKHFAYPIGGFSDQIKQIVREAGYQAACATNRGYDRYNKDVFELNRVRFSDKDNRNDYLWIKLSGYYNLFRKAKNPY